MFTDNLVFVPGDILYLYISKYVMTVVLQASKSVILLHYNVTTFIHFNVLIMFSIIKMKSSCTQNSNRKFEDQSFNKNI